MASSRDWVCIRVATYEDPEEFARLRALYNSGMGGLETIFDPLTGKLENTTFGLFAPDGETALSCIGRSPQFVLDTIRVAGEAVSGSGDDPTRFAGLLDQLGERYDAERPFAALPLGLDFRRALNVAACEDQPLVVLAADELEAPLAELAWGERHVGLFQYVRLTPDDDLAAIGGRPEDAGAFVVRPDLFGLEGAVLAHAPRDADRGALEAMLDESLRDFEREVLDRFEHVARGESAGVHWEPVVSTNTGKEGL